MKTFRNLTFTTALATCLGAGAMAQESGVGTATAGEWLSLTGEVVSVSGDRFTLDYGANDIIVEMDDFDVYDENLLIAGDQVTVTGAVDTDFVDSKTLEASSVYVDSLNEFFYASSADEEDGYYSFAANDYWDGGEWVSMTGEVMSIDGKQFTLDAGIGEYIVDTDRLGYNPLDDEGAEQIDIGERVVVSGEFDGFDLFSDEEIEAEAVTTLSGSGSS